MGHEQSIGKTPQKNNEIELKIKIKENDVNEQINFLLGSIFDEDKLKLTRRNTTLIIDGEKVPFKKYFIPKKSGLYSVKLIFKKKLSNCSHMFSECNNIIDIDFSLFNTENVKDISYMFYQCTGLKSLDLKSFNTQNTKCN